MNPSSVADSRLIPESRRPQARGIKTRERLLVAGRNLFAKNGYEGTSIGDVARLAGVGVGTVYHHFSDKRTLLLELLEHHEGSLLVNDAGGGGLEFSSMLDGDPRAAILALLRVAIELRRLKPSLYAVAREQGRRDPEMAAHCARSDEGQRRRIHEGIVLGQQIGKIRPEVDADAAAVVLQQFLRTATTQIAELPTEVDCEPRLQELAGLLYRYLFVAP